MSSSGPFFRRLLVVIKQTAYEEYSQVRVLAVREIRLPEASDLVGFSLAQVTRTGTQGSEMEKVGV